MPLRAIQQGHVTNNRAHTSGETAQSCCQSILCKCSWPSLDTTAHRSMVGHQHVSRMSELRASSLVRLKLLAAMVKDFCLNLQEHGGAPSGCVELCNNQLICQHPQSLI